METTPVDPPTGPRDLLGAQCLTRQVLTRIADKWTLLVAVGCLAGVVGLAGCGGSHARVPLGEAVFDAGCETCHSLIGNESLRRVGGDLLGFRLPRSEMLEFVREMPVRRTLSAPQIAAVSDYILGLEHTAPPGCSAGGC